MENSHTPSDHVLPAGEQWCAFEDGEQKTAWYPIECGDRAGWDAIAKRHPDKYQVVTRPVYAKTSASAVELLRVDLKSHVGFSAENKTWFFRVYPFSTEDKARDAEAALMSQPLTDFRPDGLSPWSGWHSERQPWSETQHKDAVCHTVFGPTWSAEDASTLISFIERTWNSRGAPMSDLSRDTQDLPQSPWPASSWAIDRIDELEAALRGLVEDLEIRSKNGVVDCSNGVYRAARSALEVQS